MRSTPSDQQTISGAMVMGRSPSSKQSPRPDLRDDLDEHTSGRSPMAAPRAGGNRGPAANKGKGAKGEDEDEFGDADVMGLLV